MMDMHPADLESLKGLLQILRDNHVQSFSRDGFSVSFFPGSETSETPEAKATVKTPEPNPLSILDLPPDVCECGHPYYGHSAEAGCYAGCAIEVCTPGHRETD